MSLPVLSFRELPTDLRELSRVLSDLNQWVRKGRSRVFASDQRFMNQINGAGKRSTQSVQPLTSNDLGGGLADIQVAAHSVQLGFGTVAYNAGSISGLLNSTLYYVYTDDAEFDGGAVTYLATTNHTIATSNDGRYYLGKITTDAPAGGGTSGGGGAGGGGGGGFLP